MSFDIVILKPDDDSVADISEVSEITPLGDRATVSNAFNSVFPGCLDGLITSAGGYSVDLLLNGSPVESAQLTLHFGQTWSEEIGDRLTKSLGSICALHGWVAFAVSDNSRVAP